MEKKKKIDLDDFAKDQKNYNVAPKQTKQTISPYLTANSVLEQHIASFKNNFYISRLTMECLLAYALVPLNTISKSLQLSVTQHKNIYNINDDKTPKNSKSLVKNNTALTVQMKRRLQLTIRSGGHHKPFTAPVYDGYLSVIRGLYGQGILGFFKGAIPHILVRTFQSYKFYEFSTTKTSIVHYIKNWVLFSAFDAVMNIANIVENRYILQNRLPQFMTYRNLLYSIQRIYRKESIMTGWRFHFISNFLLIFPMFSMNFLKLDMQKVILLSSTFHLINYPLSTCYVRLVCQSDDIGMIPIRYQSLTHALKLIFKEESLKGLYKGFTFYFLRNAITYSIMTFNAGEEGS